MTQITDEEIIPRLWFWQADHNYFRDVKIYTKKVIKF